MSRRTTALVGLASLAVLAAGVVVAVLASSSGGRAAARAWSEPSRAPIPAPAVASAAAIIDPAGRVHVAFVEHQGGAASLLEVVREPGGRWSAPAPIATSRPFSITIEGLAANARGDASVIWTYGGDRRQILVASTRAAGGRWGAEQALSRPTPGLGRAQIGIDRSGTTTVVGRGLDGRGLWVTRMVPGQGWRRLTRISPAGLGTDAPVLEVSPTGRATVLALLKRPGHPRLLWSRSADPSGRWDSGARLPGSQFAREPALAIGTDGAMVASWSRQPGGLASDLLVATRARGGAWSSPRAADPENSQPGESALFAEASGASLVWARPDGPSQDRVASIRARTIEPSAPVGPLTTVAALHLAPVPSQGEVVFGPVPIQLVVTSGSEPAVLWSATSAAHPRDPATVNVATRTSDGTWGAPTRLGTPGRLAFPVAIANVPDQTVAVWMEAPPLGTARALLVAER